MNKKIIWGIVIVVLVVFAFLPIYNGRVICGINPEKGCWNAKVNIFEYFKESPRELEVTETTVETPKPSITSISPSSGSIGTFIEIKGKNLAGFEGDLDAWIENSKGEKGYLSGIGSVPRTDQVIRVKLDSKLCTRSTSGTGACIGESYFTVTPGVYKIYTAPWGVKSNSFQFIVTSSDVSTTNWKTYINKKFGFLIKYPADWQVTTKGQGEMVSATESSDILSITKGDESVIFDIAALSSDRLGSYYASAKNLQEYLDLRPNVDQYGNVIRRYTQTTTISGQKALFYEGPVGTGSAEIYWQNGSILYQVKITPLGPVSSEILSTFKFI